LVLLASSVALLFAIAPLVDGDRVTHLEAQVFRFFNDLPGFLYRLLWPFMQLGNLLVVPAAFLVVLILRRWRLSAAIVLLGVGKMKLGGFVKDQVVRHRPAVLLENVVARDNSGTGQAFVSGHVVVAVGLATLLHPYLGRRGRIIVWTLAGIVALGRVYFGAHLPLDVVGGAALGCGIASAAQLLVGIDRPRGAKRRKYW
jgi:undecaprenyl-diphosphatase